MRILIRIRALPLALQILRSKSCGRTQALSVLMSTHFDNVRRDPTPASNAYNVRQPISNVSAASAAFNSDSERLAIHKEAVDTESERTGNPAAVANRMKGSKSFSRSALNGNSGFGSCGGRDLPWAATARDEAPREAPRSARRSASPRAGSPRPQRPSGAFASKSDRFGPHREATPGPGAYTEREATAGSSVRRSASFGTSKRFQDLQSNGPDPGAYESKAKSAFAPPNMSGPSSSFGSRTGRELFSKLESTGTDNGPGSHYNDTWNSMGGKAARQHLVGAPSAAFADRSGRFERPCSGAPKGPDPGAYNPSERENIGAVSARGTFGKSAARGAGGFGSSSARETREFILRDGAEEAPGPGAYDARPLSPHNGSRSARGSAQFASKSSRLGPVRNADTPSVGQYDASEHQSLAKAANKSFNKSVGSFGSRSKRDLDRDVRVDKPGPGAYAQDLNTLERSTIGSRGKMSSSFANGTVGRDSFLGL